MYCTKCGQNIPNNQTRCPICGNDQSNRVSGQYVWSDPNQNPYTASATAPAQPQAYQQQAQPYQQQAQPYQQQGYQQQPQPYQQQAQPYQQQGYQQQAQPYPSYFQQAPVVSTRKDFLKLPENKKIRKEIMSTGIICYVCAGITLISALLSNMYGILDAIILLVLGLLIHLISSRVAAVILLIDGIAGTILSLISDGELRGYLIVIAGVFAVIYTFKLEKSWKAYKSEHNL